MFDADGVVQSLPDGSLDRLAATLGVDVADLGELFEAERPAIAGSVSLASALGPVLARLGKQRLLEETLALWCQAELDQGVLAIVRQLRRSGVRCFLGTNQVDARAAFMRTTLGYNEMFDASFYSCELGFAKPDPAFFEAVLNRVGAVGSQLLFIDDRPENVAAARAAGMRGEVYSREQGIGRLNEILLNHGLDVRSVGHGPLPSRQVASTSLDAAPSSEVDCPQ